MMRWLVRGTKPLVIFSIIVLAGGRCSTLQEPGVTSRPKEYIPTAKSLSVDVGQTSISISCPLLSVEQQENKGRNIIWILERVNLAISSASDNALKYRYMESSGQLEIHNVSEDDAGIYRCIAPDNKVVGMYDTATVELLVGDPTPPTPTSTPTRQQDHGITGGNKVPQGKNALVRAITAGIAAFIFFCTSCTLYHYRSCKKPPTNHNSTLEQNSSPKSKSDITTTSSNLTSSLLPTPPTNKSRIYLLPSNNNGDTTIQLPIIRPPSTTTQPPLVTTNVELTTISGKKISSRRRDGSERNIFLQPPSSISPNRAKNLPFLYPPPPAPPSQKMFLATPETSSSLSMVIEEETNSSGGVVLGSGDFLTITSTTPAILI